MHNRILNNDFVKIDETDYKIGSPYTYASVVAGETNTITNSKDKNRHEIFIIRFVGVYFIESYYNTIFVIDTIIL